MSGVYQSAGKAMWTLVCIFVLFSLTATAQAHENGLTYELSIAGLEGETYSRIRKKFNDSSYLRSKSNEPIVSVANMRGRIKSDAELMRRVLRAEGYYAGTIDTRTARTGNRFIVSMQVLPNEQYVFGKINYKFSGEQPAANVIENIEKAVQLRSGDPAVAAVFVDAEARLDTALAELGFPFVKTVKHDLVVDHKTKKMNVTFDLDTGPQARMGNVQFDGLETVKPNYLLRLVEWEEDSFYSQRHIENYRARLTQSGLFSSVNIELRRGSEEGIVDAHVTVVEAAHRTLGTTAGYSTAEGVGAEVSWEHRNMFGRGGVFKATARAAEIEQSFASRLELPNFARLDQTVSIEGLVRRQDTDAFLSYQAEARAGVDRLITPVIALSAGGVLEYSDVTDAQGNREFLLASLPLGARWDNSDDLLNPTRGFRASVVTAPSINLGNNGFTFLKTEVRASTYLSLMEDQDLILAFRTRLGSITGVGNNTLPATQRFFAGGGGSIRGFSFQNVGPVDVEGDPLGGRSVAEVSAEVRLKVSDSIGIVPFIEGGNTYIEALPDFSSFRWGVGLGARYYTSFGPIRFDVATPLDRQPGESRIQFYISLGQAF